MRSSEAKRYARVARVSKLKGLRTSVAGNSLMTSMKTRSDAVKIAGSKSGTCTFRSTFSGEAPKDRAALSSWGWIWAMPLSQLLNAIVRNLAAYTNIKEAIVPVIQSFGGMSNQRTKIGDIHLSTSISGPISPIARTNPGKAYPRMAVRTLKRMKMLGLSLIE